jgi:phage shock protein PspC (stress-responsive transcriptional regulator)
MSAMASAAAQQPTPSVRPSLRRDRARGRVGGVCAGLGTRLGIDPRLLRGGFLIAGLIGGVGVIAYVAAWAIIPALPGSRSVDRRARFLIAAGAGLLVLAALLSLRELGLWFSDVVVWPALLAAVGGSLLWGQAARPGLEPPAPGPGTPEPEPAAVSAERTAEVYRGGFGVALVLGAVLLFLQGTGSLGPLRDVVLAVVVIALGLALVLAPFLWRLGRNLATERTERIRSQERADLAAHLHDSVLQTLALVQKRADDPRAVATLARRQERELRAWLWEDAALSAAPDASLAASLRAVGAEVEEAHGVPVEVVTVGDAALDEGVRALVAAAREALTNAAKFAGDAGPVQLFAECDGTTAQVFVRDRGTGFDPDAVPEDRRGVRDSILGRMDRHGGRASVHAAPGGGTEVELCVEVKR